MRRFLLFALYQTAMFVLIVVNFRFIAQAHYLGAVVSDTVIAFFGFAATKHIAKSDSKVDWAGFTFGGALGSVVGIYISKLLMGQ